MDILKHCLERFVEMAQPVKHLLCKHEQVSLIPGSHIKIWGVVMHCTLNTKEEEIGGALANQPS